MARVDTRFMQPTGRFDCRESLVLVDHRQSLLDERSTDLPRELRAAILLAVQAERQTHHDNLRIRVREERQQAIAVRLHAGSPNRRPGLGNRNFCIRPRDANRLRSHIEPNEPRHARRVTT